MPKSHPIPQLSIVVPFGSDPTAFESTLISVLENQPQGSEVLVPHDGSYDDPFELCEEVRFVVADSLHLVDLVSSAARHARGRFVHVIAAGLRATCGWTDAAVDCFDHFDTGVATPVIRSSATHGIVAAGWSDSSARLCQSHGQGDESVEATARVGAYLQASFWRREVLRSLRAAFQGRDPVEASVAYHHLVKQAGWRTELSLESMVICDGERLPWDQGSLVRGLRLRAIRNHFLGGGWAQSMVSGGVATLASLSRPRLLSEAIGQMLAPLAATKMASQIRDEEVTPCDEQSMIVALPKRTAVAKRRAA